ncbi:Hypothetical protein Eab7_0215 [Exiguobacterium antarcticum B7]|nr:Hypothetical protein Eab7_0215 [Exiguobacterium antarcticum B7]
MLETSKSGDSGNVFSRRIVDMNFITNASKNETRKARKKQFADLEA